MPNHVRNDLTIKGEPHILRDIVEFMRGETPFDFNKLIQCPPILQEMHTGSTEIDGKQFDNWRVIDGKEVGLTAKEAKDLLAKYGATDWYDWCCENWGTKWNAYSVKKPKLTGKSLRFSFDTAWASPTPILQALANKFNVPIHIAISGEVDEEESYTIHPE